jgi:acyl-CoA thioesterase FadM
MRGSPMSLIEFYRESAAAHYRKELERGQPVEIEISARDANEARAELDALIWRIDPRAKALPITHREPHRFRALLQPQPQQPKAK